MNKKKLRDHAERIIMEHSADIEYCWVYEDDELENQEGVWEDIYNLILSAKIHVEFPKEEFV